MMSKQLAHNYSFPVKDIHKSGAFERRQMNTVYATKNKQQPFTLQVDEHKAITDKMKHDTID